MKKIAVVLFAALFSLGAVAQEKRPELTPEQNLKVVWALSNAVTALVTGWFVLPAAMLTGKREGLCEVMKGKYDPAAPDQCAGGDWVRIVPYLKDLKD